MVRAGVALVTAVATMAVPLAGLAQCRSDVDCKGKRVCERGRCIRVDDEGVDVRYARPPPADSGWSLPAAIVGTVSGAAVVGLSLASELVEDPRRTSIGLELAAFVLLAAAAPVTFVGGKSARNQPDVDGITALRIVGWVFYGITVGVSGILILTRIADVDPPEGFITGTGAAAALTLACFSVDAVVGWHEAEELAAHDFGWGPVIGMAIDDDGARLPTIGAATRF